MDELLIRLQAEIRILKKYAEKHKHDYDDYGADFTSGKIEAFTQVVELIKGANNG